MSKLGYCGRIVRVVAKSHKEYALVNSGSDYYYLTKCEFDKALDMYMEDTSEDNHWNLWYDKELITNGE